MKNMFLKLDNLIIEWRYEGIYVDYKDRNFEKGGI